jgi:RND family efflux transporter MFP subunit
MQADTVIAERRLQELEVQLQFATVTAPFTGVIAVRHAEPGDLVQPDANAAALFKLIQVDKVRIHVSVPERDAAAINRGDAVRIQFPSFTNAEVLEVEVTRTTGQLDPATRMMRVEAEVDNKDGRLLPGMFGQATIELGVRSDVAVLPARAVRFSDTGDAFVYAVNDSKVQVLPIVTGADDGRTIEIVSGLNDQQTFVDAHRQRFEAGQTVEVLN